LVKVDGAEKRRVVLMIPVWNIAPDETHPE